MTMSTITRIEATNVYCFSTFAMDVPREGAIVEGGNAHGKTSVLNTIRAALIEKGATKDMIKKGTDKGEIMVRVDGYVVRRVMHGGDKFRTTVRVTDNDGKNVPEPMTFLKNLLGLSPLDPIELFLERDKGKRRAKILSAIPCVVTAEQLVAWCPPGADIVQLVGDDGMGSPALADHGLEVIERARKALYVQRTESNRVVKERQRAADETTAREGKEYDAFLAYREQHALPEKAPALEDAQLVLDEAKRAEMALTEQRRAAEQSASRQARTRDAIGKIRQRAADMRANMPLAPTEDEFAEAAANTNTMQQRYFAARTRVEELERLLETAREEREACARAMSAATTKETQLVEQRKKVETTTAEIEQLDGQALELEQALGALPIAPSEAQFAEAARRINVAGSLVEYARKAAELANHAEAATKARAMLRSAQADAETLDRSVKVLADEAPAALLAAADGIKGLSIDGDDIYLDGVSLDQLSGQERLFFAIEIARRTNAKSKLLCVDGIEVLDAEHRKVFIERATAGGYQLIATRVVDAGGAPEAKPIRELT
jgi:hypothetical protein